MLRLGQPGVKPWTEIPYSKNGINHGYSCCRPFPAVVVCQSNEKSCFVVIQFKIVLQHPRTKGNFPCFLRVKAGLTKRNVNLCIFYTTMNIRQMSLTISKSLLVYSLNRMGPRQERWGTSHSKMRSSQRVYHWSTLAEITSKNVT